MITYISQNYGKYVAQILYNAIKPFTPNKSLRERCCNSLNIIKMYVGKEAVRGWVYRLATTLVYIPFRSRITWSYAAMIKKT